jgi:hypothetical protein
MNPTPRRIGAAVAGLVLAGWPASPPALAQGGEAQRPAEASRQEIVAAVVVKLAAFTSWPASAGTGYAICLYGNGGLAMHVEAHQGTPARDGVVLVRRVGQTVAVPGCHAAVVGGEGARRVEAVAEAYRGRPVLVVAEGDDAIDRGAMVGLASAEGRVVFDVNRSAASREGVDFSSKLLRLARRVR